MTAAAQVPPATPQRWRRVVGIDPGSNTGMIALLVPASNRVVDSRLIGAKTVTHGGAVDGVGVTPQARALLFFTVRETLLRWRPELVVIEEPWDALPTWRSGVGKNRKQGGAGTGTIFTLGAHFGLVLAAAASLPESPKIATHPITTHKPKRGRPGVLGWMQRRQATPPPRERTRDECAHLLRDLCQRPASGAVAIQRRIDEWVAHVRESEVDVLMALGVLTFHLDRERGAV